jgi:spoIIIJ-associated protein
MATTAQTSFEPTILTTAQALIDQLGFADRVTLSVQPSESSEIYQLNLETKEPAIVIGYHGETLSAIQLLLGLHLHANTGQWLNLSVNVNDYRQRRESSLHSLADSVVAKVLATHTPQTLPPMPASERRLVHLYLSQHPKVTTASEGVGRSRSIIISPK